MILELKFGYKFRLGATRKKIYRIGIIQLNCPLEHFRSWPQRWLGWEPTQKYDGGNSHSDLLFTYQYSRLITGTQVHSTNKRNQKYLRVYFIYSLTCAEVERQQQSTKAPDKYPCVAHGGASHKEEQMCAMGWRQHAHLHCATRGWPKHHKGSRQIPLGNHLEFGGK